MLQDRDTFTASTPMINMTGGRYVDYLSVNSTGVQTTDTDPTVATFMGSINPFEVFLKGSPVVQATFEELYALDLLAFGINPFNKAAAPTNTSDQVNIGVTVPLWQPPRSLGELKYRATFNTVTSIGSNTLTVMEASNTRVLNPKYLQYVSLPSTSAGATGYGNRVEIGRTIGELEGMLIRAATIPTTTAETSTVQRIDIYANEVKTGTREWRELAIDAKTGFHPLFTAPADTTIIDNYRFLNMTYDPIPRGVNVRFDYDTQATATAARFMPLLAV